MPSDDVSEVPMTPEQRAEARLYGRLSLACHLAGKVLDLLYLALVAGLAAVPLDAWLARNRLLDRCWTLRLMALAAMVATGHMCLSFPLSYYAGYRLEHRFGLSTLRVARWLWRQVKLGLLGGLLGLVLTVGLYWIIWLTGGWWWLPAAGAFFLVSVVLGQLVPVLILPLFYSIERLDRPDLSRRLAELAQGTGLTIEGVYRMALSEATVKANAMLAGLGRTRRVLLGDTLLDRFTPDEIAVIFAHEVGHHVYRHIPKMLLAGLVTSAGRPGAVRSTAVGLGRRALSRRRRVVHARGQPAGVDADSDRFLSGVGAGPERGEPALRAAVRPLRAAAHGPAGGVSQRVRQAGPAQQGRPRPALAGGRAFPQPSAHQPAIGHGAPARWSVQARPLRVTRRPAGSHAILP